MGKILYLECNAGISGDMIAGALLDLGADKEAVRRALASVPGGGFRTEIGRVKKAGIDCCDFRVLLDAGHENHDHDMEYLHGHEHVHDDVHGHENGQEHMHEEVHAHEHEHEHEHEHGHEHEHEHEHEHGHEHEHEHEHEHGHGHEHEHHHHHEHRSFADVRNILNDIDMTDSARALALKIFTVLAEAEAKAHAVPLDEVHFHEVGAIDSIVDIVTVAVCFDSLEISDVVIPYLCEGEGTVRCQHGILPIPVPAVANIVKDCGLPLRLTGVRGELVTPTGAAIAGALRTTSALPETFSIEKIGLGAGKRNYERPSILRAMLIEAAQVPGARSSAGEASGRFAGVGAGDADAASASGSVGEVSGKFVGVGAGDADAASASGSVGEASGKSAGGGADNANSALANSGEDENGAKAAGQLWKLETNIDDSTGEQLGYTMERLLEAGARDVFYTPIYMKKNRPAYMLSVICTEDVRGRLEAILFTETTTIGVRRIAAERTCLSREQRIVETPYGTAEVKVAATPDGERIYPEYESAAKLARENGLPLASMYRQIEKAADRGESVL